MMCAQPAAACSLPPAASGLCQLAGWWGGRLRCRRPQVLRCASAPAAAARHPPCARPACSLPAAGGSPWPAHQLGPLGHHQRRPALPRHRKQGQRRRLRSGPRCARGGWEAGWQAAGRLAGWLGGRARLLPLWAPALPNVRSLQLAAHATTLPPAAHPLLPQTWTTTTPSCARASPTGCAGCTPTWALRAGALTLCAATRPSTAKSA